MRNCYENFSSCSDSSKLALLLFLLFFAPFGGAIAQSGFQHGYDESNNRENGGGMDADGTGYIFTGTTDSPTDPGDILFVHGDPNVLLNNAVRIKDGNAALAEWGNDVKAAPQGAYVVAGAQRNANQLNQAMLTQLSTVGNAVQWCRTYTNGTLPTYFNAVAPVSNYGYAAAGYAGNSLSGSGDTDLLITIASNNTGSVLYGNSFGGNGNEVAHDIIALNNGQFLAVGSTESFGAQGKAMYLVLIDSTCSKVWSRIVDGPGDDIAYSATQDDFGLVIVGQSTSFNTNGRWNTMLSRFNLGGLYLASNVYENPNYEEGARAVQYLGINDGYVLAGRTLDQDSLAWIMKLSINYSVDWFNQYENIEIVDLMRNSGGNYVGVGSHRPTGSNRNDLYVINAESSGSTGSSCNPVALTPNSMVVQPTTATGQDTVQVVNSTTNLNCLSTAIQLAMYDACTFVGIAPGLPGRVSLYPNPSAGALAVDYAFDGWREARIEVYDLRGRSLLEKDLGTTDRGVERLDLGELPSGTYLMRLRADGDVWTRKVVVDHH